MRRLTLALTALAILPVLPLGCGSKRSTAIVVAVSTEALAPAEIDTLVIQVDRGGANGFSNEYSLANGDVALPGTLTFENQKGEDIGDPIHVSILERLGPKTRVLRTATLGFSDQNTKLLRMPLRYSCMDLATPCASGQSCIGGTCLPDKIDVETLPDFTPELVFGAAGSSACFDDSQNGETACLATLNDVDLTKLSVDCVLPVAALAGKLNVAAHWDKSMDPSRLVVLDADAQEGFTFVDAKQSSIRLAPGVCAATRAGHVTQMRYSNACTPKQITQPVCQKAPPTTGGTAMTCADYATTICSSYIKCFASLLNSYLGDMTACVTEITLGCTAETTAPGANASWIPGCAKGLADCSGVQSGDAFRACAGKGTLADGAGCMYGTQCSSGFCNVTSSGSGPGCGVCAPTGKAGGPCGAANSVELFGSDCATGTACSGVGGTCVPVAKLGSACNTTGDNCPGTLFTCLGGKCALPAGKAGDSCGAGGASSVDNACDSVTDSLHCDSTKHVCVNDPTPAGLGKPCGDINGTGDYVECLAGTSCVYAATGTTGACVVSPKMGETCTDGGGGPYCAYGLSCVGGKCGEPDPKVCTAGASCAKDCGGGQCVGGECQPVKLVSVSDTGTFLLSGSTLVYDDFNSGASFIYALPTSGGMPRALVGPDVTGFAPYHFTVFENEVYFCGGSLNVNSNPVSKVSLNGGAITQIAMFSGNCDAIATDGTSVFLSADSLLAISIAKGTSTTLLSSAPTAEHLAVSGSTIFLEYFELGTVPVGGGMLTNVDTSSPGGLTVGGSSVYWFTAGPPVAIKSWTGGKTTTIPATLPTTMIYDLTIDPGLTTLYAGGVGIYSVPASGGSATAVSTTATASRLVVDQSQIYFLDVLAASGSISRLPR